MQKDRDSDFQLQLAFLKEFQRAHNRPLRVLHIGNIANNAYNNALIQRRFGIEADVICYNYYHVMGCPEWEAASFDGNIDNMFPDWWATELGGWRRPDWFAQGPVLDCLSYLRAKNAGDGGAAAFFWTLLQARYWEMLDGIAAAESRVRPPMPEHLADTISIAREFQDFQASKAVPQPLDQPTIALPGATIEPESALSPISPASSKSASPGPQTEQSRSLANGSPNPEGPGRLVSTYRSLLAKYVFVHLRREAETGVVGRPSLAVAIWRSQRRSRGLPRFGFEFPADVFKMPDPDTATPVAGENVVFTIPSPNTVTSDASNGAAADVGSSAISVVTHPDIIDRPEFRYFENYGKGEDRNASQRAALLGDLLRQLTDYPAEALVLVEAFASTIANEFADVLEHYDIIQGYSIDGFIPFINGLKNYTCYEHGTLREMPFEKTYNGILCSASYKNAAFSFVTNSDVLPSVARLKLKRERTVYLPHAFDDEKISSFRAGLKLPKRDPKVTTFFSPTRHHWHAAPVSMQKGNDHFLRAAAQVAQTDRDFRIILVEWGVDVQRSKELIQELGIEGMVSWIPSLNKAELRQLYCSSDVVVDQFRIPAIGGVTFEAMALGRRVITNLDETQSAEFFGAAPPCLVADSVESCAARILEVLADPLDDNGCGDAARLWFEKCHSAQRVVALQLAAYRTICAA